MNSFNRSNLCSFESLIFSNDCTQRDIKALFRNFAQNREFMKICTNPQNERRERRKGFFESLKISPKQPEPPPKPPNKLENILNHIHSESLMATREIISASCASLVSVAAIQPFDVIKSEYFVNPSDKGPWYKMFSPRILHEMKSILAAKGFSRLYSGHFKAQRDSLFQTISMFYTYQRVYRELERFESIFKAYPDLCIFLSGFFSASISVLLLRPYAAFQDKLAQKRQLLQRVGPICAAYTIRLKTKWDWAFKGCFADFLYTGTQYGLRFLAYSKISEKILKCKPENVKVLDECFQSEESEKSEVAPKRVVKTLTGAESLFAGAISGLISDLAAHPMDVIKTRLKMSSLVRQHYRYDDTCRRYGQCVKIIWKKNKLRG